MRLIAAMLLLVGMSGFAVPQKGKDVPAEIMAAQQALKNARTELAKAGDDWGGHRVAAMKHVDAALAEIQEAENFARQHHDMK